MNKEFWANDVLMPFVMDYGNWIVWTFFHVSCEYLLGVKKEK